jgi:hypothetical protein
MSRRRLSGNSIQLSVVSDQLSVADCDSLNPAGSL